MLPQLLELPSSLSVSARYRCSTRWKPSAIVAAECAGLSSNVYELQRIPHLKTAQSESDGWSELATGQENFGAPQLYVRAAEDITLLSS